MLAVNVSHMAVPEQGPHPLPIETNVTRQPRRFTLALALFWFLLAVYLLTYSPRFHSSDGLAMFSMAESLARRGEWDTDQIRWMGLQQGTFGLDGRLYSRKGAGESLLELPLVWLGLIVPVWGAATTALLFNAIVTAATGALLLLYLKRLGYGDGVALVSGLTFGLATLAWPYAKTCFSDPLAGLCLVGAGLALLRLRDMGRFTDALWAGLALAVAVATRYANGVMIPFFGLLLLKYQISSVKSQISPGPRGGPSPGRKAGVGQGDGAGNPKSKILNSLAAFVAPLAVMAIAIALYNIARYGDPLNTGYLPQESFGGVWWQGIAGLLVSPGRGLFLYTPVLLMALPAAPALFRRHTVEAALAWAMVLAHLLLYGKWYMWHGGYAWGPRFMVPALPFLVIGMAPAIEWGKESAWWRRGFLALAALGGLIQVLGLSVHFELFQNRLLETGLPLYAPITFFDPRYSPLIGQFQFLRPENLDFAWVVAGRVDWPLLIVLLVAVLVSGWGLIQRPPTPYFLLPTSYSLLLTPFVVLAATVWLLTRAHAIPHGDLRDVVAALNARTTVADAIVTNTPEEATAFADLYKGHANVLGLNAGGPPLDADTVATLTRTTKSHPRVWWLPNWLPPEKSGVELWLMGNGFRAEDRSFNQKRMALFYFPPQPLKEIPSGATFGNGIVGGGVIVLERAATSPAVQADGVLPVALRWRATQPIAANYHVFVHLLDADGNRVAQSDGQPALWSRPTSGWSPGEVIEDRHALSLPADLAPGDYTLVVGLYTPLDGARLLTEGGADHVALATIRVDGRQ